LAHENKKKRNSVQF